MVGNPINILSGEKKEVLLFKKTSAFLYFKKV